MQLINKKLSWPKSAAVAVAGILIWLLMVFPQIPIQFRYLGLITAGLALFHHDALKAPGVRGIALYTIFICIVGAAVVALFDDGNLSEALYGIRTMSLCVLVMIFATNVTLSGFISLTSAILCGGFIGMVVDTYYGPAWQKMPFPIFTEVQLMLMGERYMSSDRFGGFTFEAGVIGGMSAMFILINISILLLGLWGSKLRLPSSMQLISVIGSVCGLGAIYLSRTKAAFIIIALGFFVMAVAMLFVRRGVPVWSKFLLWGVILAAFASLPLAYRMTKNTANGEYIEKEVSNAYLLITRGFDREEGGGLQTRIQSAKIAIFGLFFRPTGAGYTNGYFYAEPVLKYVEPTNEMEWFHNMGRYNGYKGAFFNLLGQGGILAIVLFVYLLRLICRGLINSGAPGGGAIASLLITGVLILGFTVELLPYFEIIMLVLGLAYIVDHQLGGFGGLAGNGVPVGSKADMSRAVLLRRLLRVGR
jgi:hypothetical protein